MDDIVLHDRLALAPWMDPALWRLPGVKPLEPEDWLIRDEAFPGQMALRDRLIANRQEAVHAITPRALEPARECLDMVLEALAQDPGYARDVETVTRPDGASVEIDRDAPLITLGHLIQADVCVMQEGPGEHVLTGAILCFPGSWTLAEKMDRPLMAIHGPVAKYDDGVGLRVQRLFDGIRPDRLLVRANAHRVHHTELFHPRSESDPPSVRHEPPGGPYLRSERQALRKLPRTGAVIFTIHTTMIPLDQLTDAQRATMAGTYLADP